MKPTPIDLETLYKGLLFEFPDAPHPDARLKASSDSAVRQFDGHLNAIGHLPGWGCPMATRICLSMCYMWGGTGMFPNVRAALAHNSHILLRLLLEGRTLMVMEQLDDLVAASERQWKRRLDRLTRSGEDPVLLRHLERGHIFRVHYSGDVLNELHAHAITAVANVRKVTDLWLYTRSFHLLRAFEPVPPNLTILLSRDPHNAPLVQQAQRKHPWATRVADLAPAEMAHA